MKNGIKPLEADNKNDYGDDTITLLMIMIILLIKELDSPY